MTSSRSSPTPGDPDRRSVRISLNGEPIAGIAGQSLAGVLLSAGRDSWRTTSVRRRPRGVFCGIGVCFDCVATVNGLRDVRLCQRSAHDGDIVVTQDDRARDDSRDEDPRA